MLDNTYTAHYDRQHLHCSLYRAEIYRKQGDITMAIVNYTQAIKMNPTDHDAYFQRAEMYEQVRRVFSSFFFLSFFFCLQGNQQLFYPQEVGLHLVQVQVTLALQLGEFCDVHML